MLDSRFFAEEKAQMEREWADHKTIIENFHPTPPIRIDFRECMESKALRKLTHTIDEHIIKGAKDFYIGIDSPGGDSLATQKAFLRFEGYQANGIRFSTHNLNLVASAAMKLFLAGQQRWSEERSRFFVHPPRGDGPPGNLGMQAECHLHMLTAFYALRSNINQQVWGAMCRRDTYISSEQAVDMKVTHGIRAWNQVIHDRTVHIIHPEAVHEWKLDYSDQ